MKKNLREEEAAWIEDMKQTEGKATKHATRNKYEQIITITMCKEHNGIELSFTHKPCEADRALLKRSGYKWHYVKCVWYAVNNSEHAAVIEKLHGRKKYPDEWKTPDTKASDTTDTTRDELEKTLQIMNNNYSYLYDNAEDKQIQRTVSKASEAFDIAMKNNPDFVKRVRDLVKVRQDAITSDREAAAYIFAEDGIDLSQMYVASVA